jgi:hypothetical protein
VCAAGTAVKTRDLAIVVDAEGLGAKIGGSRGIVDGGVETAAIEEAVALSK